MFKFLKDWWAHYRARRLVDSARNQLEERLSSYQVSHVVTDELTLTTYDLGAGHSVSSWDGEAHFPFWGKQLQVYVYPANGSVTDIELDILRKLLAYPDSIREEVLSKFAQFYNRHIYSESDNDPVVRSTKDIHSLIGDPTVVVDSMSKLDPVEFTVTFLPTWRDTSIDVYIANWVVDDPLFNNLDSMPDDV